MGIYPEDTQAELDWDREQQRRNREFVQRQREIDAARAKELEEAEAKYQRDQIVWNETARRILDR